MKHLEDALRQSKGEDSRLSHHFRQKSKTEMEKWTLDPDIVEDSPAEVRQRLTLAISSVLRKKFESEKYVEEETLRDLLRDLSTFFPLCSEVQRLARLQEILQSLADGWSGELKNSLKHFQSLLDAKLRKLRKRGKRSELVEFDRLLASEPRVRKNEVYFINEDQEARGYTGKLKRKESRHETSKRSFGTMNSGSNENESGSGKNQSGSGSKSGESNALAVLLANVDAQEERKAKNTLKEKEREKYEFTNILSATASVRQRHNLAHSTHDHPQDQTAHADQLLFEEEKEEEDKDEAFIFHHPRLHKHSKP